MRKGGFLKKAPLKSPKNFWSTAAGIFGERTQMSALACQPHRKVPPPQGGRKAAPERLLRLIYIIL